MTAIFSRRSLTWPDFSGNSHFNTLGNLLLNPRAGLLFVDFETGDLLALTGRAEIIWDGPEVESFDGALRLVRFTLDELVRLTDSLPIRWEFGGYSPILEKTGSWGRYF